MGIVRSARQANNFIGVIPRDGVRQRFHGVLAGRRLKLALDRDGFAREKPIHLHPNLATLQFILENHGIGPHPTQLKIEGLPQGRYDLSVDGQRHTLPVAVMSRMLTIDISVSEAPATQVEFKVTSRSR